MASGKRQLEACVKTVLDQIIAEALNAIYPSFAHTPKSGKTDGTDKNTDQRCWLSTSSECGCSWARTCNSE